MMETLPSGSCYSLEDNDLETASCKVRSSDTVKSLGIYEPQDGYVNSLDLALIVNKERDTQIGN